MATVELTFSALPAHVRTARLVGVAVARRSGVEEGVLDEVRLAIGEACSRAVELHRVHCPQEPVVVALEDGRDRFRIEVRDCAPMAEAVDGDVLEALEEAAELTAEPLPLGIGLAVISGLVDDVTVSSGERGAVVCMSWPAQAAV